MRVAPIWHAGGVALVCLAVGGASGATLRDATGRTVTVPDHVERILPAGPPAAVLLAALAPDLLVGWPHPLSPAQRALLPASAATLPSVPMLTGKTDETASVAPLHPDLILDYGTVSPRYVALDEAIQRRTGVPTVLLSGALPDVPEVLRRLGGVLHREKRAGLLAALAEHVLSTARAHPGLRVVYARGPDGLTLAAPASDASGPFDVLGWSVLAPAGDGPVRQVADPETIDRLDPDILIFEDPAMRAVVRSSPAWRAVRAVRDGHAFAAPDVPFGWLGKPPSINRLLGVAAFAGGTTPDAGTACLLLAAMIGRPPTADELVAFDAALQRVYAQGE